MKILFDSLFAKMVLTLKSVFNDVWDGYETRFTSNGNIDDIQHLLG